MKVVLVMAAAAQDETLYRRYLDILKVEQYTGNETAVWSLQPPQQAELLLPKGVTAYGYCNEKTAMDINAWLDWLCMMDEIHKPDVLAFALDIAGHELAARFAARKNRPCLMNVFAVEYTAEVFIAESKVCASNLVWRQQAKYPVVLGIQKGVIAGDILLAEAQIQMVQHHQTAGSQWIQHRELLSKAKPNKLENAQRMVVAGLGIGSAINCARARAVAEKCGAVFALTRPAALNGWGAFSEVAGQSGTICAPDYCLVLGASGAAAFAVGVENAKQLVAVNIDPDAPIFRYADVGIIEDVAMVLDAMEQQLQLP